MFNVALFGLCAIMYLWFRDLIHVCNCLIRAAPFMLLMFLNETKAFRTFPIALRVFVAFGYLVYGPALYDVDRSVEY